MSDQDPFARLAGGYQTLTKEEIASEMDARYATGRAYPDNRLWVTVAHTEIEQRMAALLRGRTAGKDVLEFGCGGAGVAAFHVTDARSITATDLSEVAIEKGRDFFKGRDELTFRRMDAEAMDLVDASVDVVLAKEVVEHLPNPDRCLAEVRRVLRPSGMFVMSSPNRDSLHLRLNRKLGLPDFMCSGDHIREYTYHEMVNMLASAGFKVVSGEGVMLMPYHYVEGVFLDSVASLQGNDEEFVEWLRDMGRRIGPHYAFCYIIVAYPK